MIDPVSISISIVSLAISGATMWFAWLKKGRLRMTKPTIVFFGFDAKPVVTAKIFLRTLLYSTSARGKMVEGMYAKLRQASKEETFSFWGYGETRTLSPGSGLYVGQTGVAANHHFVLSPTRPSYQFTTGEYTIEVYARVVGQPRPLRLSDIQIALTVEQVTALATQRYGVMFELMPESEGYIGYLDERDQPA